MDGPASDAYRYDLPPSLIARDPAARRGAARLLRWDGAAERLLGESRVDDLDGLLEPGDLLVVNDSRVLPARLPCRRATGGRVELLLTRPVGDGGWRALARPARKLAPGDRLEMDGGSGTVIVTAAAVDGEVGVIGADEDLTALAERCGRMPLPPYIEKARRDDGRDAEHPDDRERYQTVYAREDGSVAAPTAGLHLDDALLARLEVRGVGLARVTLHVGVGTFRNPDEGDLADGRLHAETFAFPADVDRAVRDARAAGGRVVAVGTTSLRVLETVARLGLDADGPDERRWTADAGDARPLFEGRAVRDGAGWDVRGATRLFLRPPERLAAADGLLTNFHLPGSSLLMLVACATGGASWRGLYDEATGRGLRFYSYGDASLIMPLAGGDR